MKRSVRIELDDNIFYVPLYTEFKDILKLEEYVSYKDNPIVGVLFNGVIAATEDRVTGDGRIEPIHLFEKRGRRIYRRTLTLLLSYAAKLVHPERTLSIGHSLGDGFYFEFNDDKSFDLERIEKEMKKAVEARMKIERLMVPDTEALRYAEENGFSSTSLLLQTRNDEAYRMVRLGSYLQLYMEPVLSDVGILTLWEVRRYENGILLRYPQSRNIEKLQEFTNNSKLFQVFQDTKKDAQNIGLSSIGELNRRRGSLEIEETIQLLEIQMRRRYMKAAEEIIGREKVRIVFIAGPSSSGKTTSALKLAEGLKILGKKPVKMSLDDYYLHKDLVPRDENGEYDFEVLEALDLDYFRSDMKTLIEGGSIRIPSFSFKTQERTLSEQETRLEENTILIIEGLHGLNPHLMPELDSSLVSRVYISALTQLNLDSQTRISTTDNRILRRMVRDNRTRGINAYETLSRWPSVERGEKNHIFPFQDNADIMINSALDYEIGVLKPLVEPLLRSVRREDGKEYAEARRLLAFLDYVYPIEEKMVPPDSLLREFIGGGIYKVI